MSRTLLCGPAGAGRTHAVLEAVLALHGRAGSLPRFLVLVPTYSQAEHLKRRLLRLSRGDALLDRGVVTFEQLAERRTGIRLGSLAPAPVRDAVLAAAFEEAGDDVLRESARFPGLRRATLRLLDEVKALETDPSADVVAAAADRLAAVAGLLPAQRGAAVAALARVLSVYERRRRAEGLRDHGDLLRELLRAVRAGRVGRYELFAMDGFADLTPVQEAIVHGLADASARSLVTLVADAEDRPGSPFAACERLRTRLAAAGFVAEHRAGSRRLTGDLLRLERRLAGADVAPAPPTGSVRFLAGADPDDEADRVARTVLRWTTEGVERSEILVVLRSAASETAARVLDALRRHGVPARRIGGEPLATVPCVRSALRVMRLVAGADDAETVAGAVRAGDAQGVGDADADRLGLLVRERGARDARDVRALADAAGAASVLAWLDAVAARRLPPGPQPVADTAAALVAAVPALVRLRFAAPFDDADGAAVARDAAAMRALHDLVADLGRAARASASSVVAPAEFAARVAAAVETARFSPPEVRGDVVHVVGAEEARQWEARAVVVAGLRLGEFPAAAREDVFLSDDDRAAVERATGLRLPNRLDDALRREQLLFYAAATRARERLVLTCPLADDAGHPVLRSPFLDAAMEILPADARRLDGADRSPGDVRPAPGETLHRDDLERVALAALTERFAPGTASELRPHAGYALLPSLVAGETSVVRAAARAFAPADAALREDGPARRDVARPRARSATSLADFAQCAFRHFARKGLGLAELPAAVEDGLHALLAGEIAHRALERIVRERVTTADAASAVVDAEFARVAGHLRRDLRAEAVRAELRRAIVAHALAWRGGAIVDGFAPAHLEWTFGLDGGADVAVDPREAPVRLTGAADRIDVAPDGRALVVDYKWSRRDRFAGVERRIADGTDLQLPVYALAAARALGVRVVAAGYVTLRDGDVKWLRVTADAPVGRGSRTPPPPGWGEDDGAAGLARAEAHVVELDRRIRAGACAATPRDEDRCGPSRCAYADLCRYEAQPR